MIDKETSLTQNSTIMKTKQFQVMNAVKNTVKNTVMNTRYELAKANLDLIDMVIYGSKVGSK